MILINTNLFSEVTPKSIITVDIDGTGDYVSIQEGIDAASSFDTVLVYPGIYYENIDYSGKNIILASKYQTTGDESYIDSTIIDGNENGSCVLVNSGESGAEIIGFTLQNGSGYDTGYRTYGGGIFINNNSSLTIEFCKIINNYAAAGGGISSNECPLLNIKGTDIIGNFAHSSGGGIGRGNDDVNINFSSFNKCNIYNNYAPIGSDIYNHKGDMDVIVDTFTVEEPTKFYAYSREGEITMNIGNHKIEPINDDLYVSPDGDNSNSGLTPSDPLLNIYDALIKIKSDSTHPNTIHLAEGIYSPSETGEFFAVGGKDYLSIVGAGKNETILDAEQTSGIMNIANLNYFSARDMKFQHGYFGGGGAMGINNSPNLVLKNLNLWNNLGKHILASHMLIHGPSPIFDNINISTNYTYVNEKAIKCEADFVPLFKDVVIKNIKSDPQTGYYGAMTIGGNYPVFINCLIANNYGQLSSGISSIWSGDTIYVINSTIADNDDCSGGTIRLVDNSHIHLINTILRNESDTEIYFHPQHNPNSASLEYCNVDGGMTAIDVNNNGTLNWGEGNIDQDPLFEGGDPFSYQLSAGSPCIDSGTPDTTGLNLPATDLAGNPRIYNGRVDIGAYEYKPEAVGGDPDTNFVNKLYLFQNQPNPFK
ncbi:MAG: hypothetical protein KGY75_03505, partial [Candidatus Cloacimonetes bacterium]|nr:hypothetical protein [Candidatus Cloacimonadota bacterium]